MPIPFIIGLIPVFLAPVWTLRVLSDLLAQERSQIAVDNAAILAGRGEREVLNILVRANTQLRSMDSAHHSLHICARGRSATPGCVAADLAAERAIAGYRNIAMRKATLRRSESYRRVVHEYNRLESDHLLQIDRPSVLPVRETRCSICGIEVEWEITRVPSYVLTAGEFRTRLTLRGSSLRTAREWDYQLEESDS